jgi:hypothetical protein
MVNPHCLESGFFNHAVTTLFPSDAAPFSRFFQATLASVALRVLKLRCCTVKGRLPFIFSIFRHQLLQSRPFQLLQRYPQFQTAADSIDLPDSNVGVEFFSNFEIVILETRQRLPSSP